MTKKLATGVRTAKKLIGRTIIGVEMNPFDAGPQASPKTQFNPTFLLDNGDSVMFHVTETDGLDCYGVEPIFAHRA